MAPVDVAGALFAVIGLVTLVFGLIESANLGWGSPLIVGAFVLSGLAIGSFVGYEWRLERRGRSPLMPLGIWRRPQLVAANVAGLVYFFLFYGILYFLSLALEGTGLSELLVGVAFLPMLVVQALVGPLAGRLAARFGLVAVLLVGFVLGVLGAVLLALLPSVPTLADLEWRFVVLGIGCGLMSSPMSNLAVSGVPTTQANTASALHTTSRQIGSTLGVAVLGLIPGAAAFGSGFSRAMGTIAMTLAAGGLVVAALTLRRSAR